MSDTALLVIDVQESFRQRPYWDATEVTPFVQRLQALIDGCQAAGIPVVQVFHVDGDGPFSVESGFVRTLEPLHLNPSFSVHKSRHSALAGTPLKDWLISHGIRRVIISGIRTEQCCETTARHASDSGFEVDYVTEATLTFPMEHAGSGKRFTAQDLRERTETVLEGRFARIRTVDQVLSELATPVPAR